MSDWGSVKARLEEDAVEAERGFCSEGTERQAADIRAALEKIAELQEELIEARRQE